MPRGGKQPETAFFHFTDSAVEESKHPEADFFQFTLYDAVEELQLQPGTSKPS